LEQVFLTQEDLVSVLYQAHLITPRAAVAIDLVALEPLRRFYDFEAANDRCFVGELDVHFDESKLMARNIANVEYMTLRVLQLRFGRRFEQKFLFFLGVG